MDTRFSIKEKAIIYTEDVRASLISLKSVFEFTKKRASEEEYVNSYKSSLECLCSKIKSGEVIPASSSTDKTKAFIPGLNTSDQVYKQAIFTK